MTNSPSAVADDPDASPLTTGSPALHGGTAGEIRRALKAGWPVLIALVPMALVLGAQAARRGLSVPEVTLMTALNYAGGSEFAAVGLWTSPLPVALIVGITVLVNCRHLLMGAALAPYLRHHSQRVIYPALFVMVDESWAISLADARKRSAAGVAPPFSLPFYVTLGVMFCKRDSTAASGYAAWDCCC